MTGLVWLHRIIHGVLAMALALFLWSSYDAWLGDNSRKLWNTVLSETSHGTWMTPPGEGPFPAIVVLHEWWGLNQNTLELSELLVKDGYAVLAIDTFRGRVAHYFPGALLLNLTTNQLNVQKDIDSGMTWLRQNPMVITDKIAVLGFCFGGREAMRLGVRDADIASLVTLYDGSMITDKAELGYLGAKGPVLAIYGEDDTRIPVSLVKRFESAMNVSGIDNTTEIYPDAVHAFLSPTTINEEGAAQAAWQQIKDFFAQTLQTASIN